MMWAVTLRYRLADVAGETLEGWETDLVHLDATVARIPGDAATVTVYVEAVDPVEAVTAGADAVLPVVGMSPLAVSAVDEETHLEEAVRANLPELVSAPEVAELLNVSRQRVHQLQSMAGFPEPLYRLKTGPVWDAAAVKFFAVGWDRRPGRRVAPRRNLSQTASLRRMAARS